MAGSVVPLRSSAPQTKVCADVDCAKAGEPQPLDAFYFKRRAGGDRQRTCKECERRRARIRQAPWRHVDAGLHVVSAPAANEQPSAEEELDEPEDLAPETILDRAWRVYEREERERSGSPEVPPQTRDKWSRALDVDEAERFANEVIAELRAGASLAAALERANVDTSLGDEERPLDLFKTSEAPATVGASQGDRSPDHSRAEAPKSANREAAPSSPATIDAPPSPVRPNPLAKGSAGAVIKCDTPIRQATSLAEPRTRTREGSPPKRGSEPAAPPATSPAPPPSGPRALVQVMSLERFEEQHMGGRNGTGELVEAACAKRAKTIVELVDELKLQPQQVRNALYRGRATGRMSCDDEGRWGTTGATRKKLVEVTPRSIAAAKASARASAPASTSLAGFLPPPHVAEQDQFGRELLVVRERVIARACHQVAKIDELIASFSG